MHIIFLAMAIAIWLWFWRSPALMPVQGGPTEASVKPGKAVEWLGAACGLLGSFLLAANNEYSGYGFVAFIVSNACWLWFGLRTRTWGMVTMQAGFTASSGLGIYRWLL